MNLRYTGLWKPGASYELCYRHIHNNREKSVVATPAMLRTYIKQLEEEINYAKHALKEIENGTSA